MIIKLTQLWLVILLIGTAACDGSSEPVQENEVTSNKPISTLLPPKDNPVIPDNTTNMAPRILLLGNSHIRGLKDLVSKFMSESHRQSVIEAKGGGFLDERLNVASDLDLLSQGNWTHVIIQGQKYSQSWTTHYPTVATEIWINRTKKLGATPILFPEHPQRGNTSEGKKVYELHVGISQKQSSCVAPIGPAWDLAIQRIPDLQLHDEDGNHAALTGSMLTAFVFYEIITGESADLLPFIPGLGISESIQDALGQIASESLAMHPGCKWEQ